MKASRQPSSRLLKSPCSRGAMCCWTTRPPSTYSATRIFLRIFGNRRGVQLEAKGVRVDQEGDFGEIGPVYYSRGATANILSFTAMADSGADIRYDHEAGCFILQPAGSRTTYSFSRQKLPGSTGCFYVCDASGMGRARPSREAAEQAFVATVADNMMRFTKREIAPAAAARELFARMGYPPVEMAIAMIRGGSNFNVSEADFRNAHTIWGKCLASLRGKTHKKSSPVADISLTPAPAQQQQVLSVDIMYLETYRSFYPSGHDPCCEPHSVRHRQSLSSSSSGEDGIR